MAVSEIRLEAARQGMTGVARKVLDYVPIAEGWPAAIIRAEMLKRGGTAPAFHVVEGCLKTLVEAGLVTRPDPVNYQRVTGRPKAEKAEKTEKQVQPKQEPEVNTTTISKSTIKTTSPMDRMAKLAQDLRALANTAEEIALDIETQIQDLNAGQEKLRQFKSLLQGL